MLERARPWLAGLALLGCYEDPGSLSTEQVLTIIAAPTFAEADGVYEVEVIVSLAGDATTGRPVTLRASDGTWLGGQPQEDGAITLPVPAGGGDQPKEISAPLRMGRTPGVVRVEAEIDGYVARVAVEADRAWPDALFGAADVATLPADGRSLIHLTFDFDRADGATSLGTPLSLVACCVDGTRPVACGFRPPLRVAPRKRLEAGTSLAVDAVAEQLTATEAPSGTLAVEIIARASDAPPTCADPGDDPLAVRLPLTLTVALPD